MYPTFCRLLSLLARAACFSLLACAAFSCAKRMPPPSEVGFGEVEPPLPPPWWAQEAMRFVQLQNEGLWKHWVSGEPLKLTSLHAGFENLFSETTWQEMQSMPRPASPAQACALKNLRAFVLGELLALKLRKQNHELALLENKLTVMYQARDFPWHELGRLLAHETSHLHRKNLWLYSLRKAKPLEAAIQAREKKTAQLLEGLGLDEEGATQLFRDVDLKMLEVELGRRLRQTQTSWCTQVEAMAAQQKDMLYATRADLPFFFQAKLPESHLHFPAKQQEALVDTVFERLGLWPEPRLVRHIGDMRVALPLPLALNGGFEESRLSFAPAQGPHSLRQLLGEMGRALSWVHVAQDNWACRHLGPPIVSSASALVFAQLVQDKTWLVEQGLSESLAKEWEKALRAQAEFEFRTMAANFLAQLSSHALSEEEASKAYVSTQAQVLCVQPLEAEALRLHVDREEFFAMADKLRSWLWAERIGEALKAHFGQSWWGEPKAGLWLKTLWKEGNALPAEQLIEASSAPPSWPQTLPP